MRTRPALSVLVATLLTAGTAACGDDTPVEHPTVVPSAAATPAGDARNALAAHAALAADSHYTAMYTYDEVGDEPRSIMATVATDGSWRVDIPNGALGGTTDVSIAETEAGLFQCAVPSATNPVTAACVRIGERGETLPKKYDPKVQRLFLQWLSVFTDRQAALSVTTAQPLDGSTGTCFSIDSISASLAAPVDIGIYCYAEDGLLTAAKVDFGTLTLVSSAVPPQTVDLPGPVTGGDPMTMAAPPAGAVPTTSEATPAASAQAG